MKKWCLLKKYVDAFKQGLRSGEIKPEELAKMSSEERNAFLAKYVGQENAKKVNALFESKLLLKNQQSAYVTWAKKVAGITPEVRRDLMSRIEKLQKYLTPTEEVSFLSDLVSERLGINVTQKEAENIGKLSAKVTKLKKGADEEGKFDSEKERLEYGASKVALENYVNDLKLKSRRISFREQPIAKILDSISQVPGIMKSSVASFDNSFWGRQGINTLKTNPDIWVRNFLKSWRNIARQMTAKGGWLRAGDNAVMDAIKADIYSRPNSLLDKYRIGKYGIDVLTEEAFPSSFPEKIPGLGRLFKASEVAYNGGALQLRADLADRLIRQAEAAGVNTLNVDEARAIGQVVSSITGRGSLGKGEALAKEANVLLFSIKFLKGNIDTLTAHAFDPKATAYSRKLAAKNLMKIITVTAAIIGLAGLLDPDKIDTDPRSTNFGKIKVFGHWMDITGGMASLLILVSRLIPTFHNGKLSFWKKTTNGTYQDLLEGGYGKQNAMDVLWSFMQGKFSPFLGMIRDLWTGTTFTGEPISPETIAKSQLPVIVQNYEEFRKNPDSSFLLGTMILDALGFSSSSMVEPNSKTKTIPTNQKINQKSFMEQVATYAQAFGTDPETAFNRIFSGQKIIQVSDGGIIVVARQDIEDSEAFKKKWVKEHGGDVTKMREVRLDHTIPNKLGGSESPSNWKIVPVSVWSSYTKTENALIKAVKEGKLSLKEAQAEITKFKKIDDTEDRKKYGEKLQQKYK